MSIALKDGRPTRQTLEDIERAARLVETQQVVAQPHRRGDDGIMVDPFGVFVRMRKCGVLCYEAGQEYIMLVAKWKRATGLPQRWLSDEKGSGGELEDGVIDRWFAQIKDCETAMKCAGMPAFRATQNLILDDVFPEANIVQPVERAVTNLAISLGKFRF